MSPSDEQLEAMICILVRLARMQIVTENDTAMAYDARQLLKSMGIDHRTYDGKYL